LRGLPRERERHRGDRRSGRDRGRRVESDDGPPELARIVRTLLLGFGDEEILALTVADVTGAALVEAVVLVRIKIDDFLGSGDSGEKSEQRKSRPTNGRDSSPGSPPGGQVSLEKA
jgi:hypothetical protein